jgi:hypothetical protein
MQVQLWGAVQPLQRCKTCSAAVCLRPFVVPCPCCQAGVNTQSVLQSCIVAGNFFKQRAKCHRVIITRRVSNGRVTSTEWNMVTLR